MITGIAEIGLPMENARTLPGIVARAAVSVVYQLQVGAESMTGRESLDSQERGSY